LTQFSPHRSTILTIEQREYRFLPHPYFPTDDEVLAMEGGEAVIYQVQEIATRALYALKVPKPSYQDEHIARVAAALAPYRMNPGLYLGNRICLTKKNHAKLIAEYPELEYATLMPWLMGRTWAGLMLDQAASARYTRGQAFQLTLSMAQVLWNLEAYHLAHTDIAGGNVMLSPNLDRVELLDIEGLYIQGAPIPKLRSQGSPGYQHSQLDQRGQWRPDGDRFAGAILITEMLTWVNPFVRALTPDNAESLFQTRELQDQKTRRWEMVWKTLHEVCPPAVTLFERAWASHDLAECPDFSTWSLALIQTYKP
jgi:serine/threonine protein kinase